MLILKTREYQAGVQHLFKSSKQQCTTLVWSKTVDSFSLCSTLHRLLWFMITFSDPLYLYSGSSMFINLQQRLFGVGLQSLYRALQLSKFKQVKYAPFCLLSFLQRNLIRMRSSLDVLSKQLTSMKNGKVHWCQKCHYTVFLSKKEQTQGFLCYLLLMNSDWNIEMSSLNVKQHPAIVLVISTSVSIDVHFPAYPTERESASSIQNRWKKKY